MNGHPVVDQIHLHLLDRMLDAVPTPRRELLERTAFAPHITPALAIELAGEEAAARARRRSPTAGCCEGSTNGGGPIYEAHGLVRRGMQTLLHKRHGDAEVQQIALATAAALQRHGAHEDAFALLIERAVPEAAAAVLETLAERYARNGQAALLARVARAASGGDGGSQSMVVLLGGTGTAGCGRGRGAWLVRAKLRGIRTRERSQRHAPGRRVRCHRVRS